MGSEAENNSAKILKELLEKDGATEADTRKADQELGDFRDNLNAVKEEDKWEIVARNMAIAFAEIRKVRRHLGAAESRIAALEERHKSER